MGNHDIFWLIFLLIALGLVIGSPGATANVISAIGGFFTAETSTLQGKGTGYTTPAIQTNGNSNLFGL